MSVTRKEIRPDQAFWSRVAADVIAVAPDRRDLSMLTVVVPNPGLIASLRQALQHACGPNFLPPRMTTLATWCQLVSRQGYGAHSARRTMELYAELRQHAWLKRLISAKRNTDLLPLAQVILALSDELTTQQLPQCLTEPDMVLQRWQAMLEALEPAAQRVLSNEAQLVWSIWKNQLDRDDALVLEYEAMLRIADTLSGPLIWIGVHEPSSAEQAFLERCALAQPVHQWMANWHLWPKEHILGTAFGEYLPHMSSAAGEPSLEQQCGTLPLIKEYRAESLEHEASSAAQTIVDWLQAGRRRIAVIAQDRVSARRLRALLERAHIEVADETGWKLSTTRAASAIAAWFEVIASQADYVALMDLLKSPFMLRGFARRDEVLFDIETKLLASNVSAGWDAAIRVLEQVPQAREVLIDLARQARRYQGRRSLAAWTQFTRDNLEELGIWSSLRSDLAGRQVCDLIERMVQECRHSEHEFSFAEWRVFLHLQLEGTRYIAPQRDVRVRFLTLAGARLGAFDAAIVLGCDADHLPASDTETLFFGNAVRSELGLRTREVSQREQLRDLCALFWSSDETLLSWQAFRHGDPGTASPWLERLDLALRDVQGEGLPRHAVRLARQELVPEQVKMPMPSAGDLLPERLSASAYNVLVACPYQFFASRMLGLRERDELSDGPEKRDYGDWLHQILREYHETLRDQLVPVSEREALLLKISESVFERRAASATPAMAFRVRWSKALPMYVAWASEREQQGWIFRDAERAYERVLQLENTRITLQGRIDRTDVHQTGQVAVLDYKTRAAPQLKKKLGNREDHQLAFYALLAGDGENPVEEGGLVALEPSRERLGMELAPDYANWQQQLQRALVEQLSAIAGGAPLPANGVDGVCQYCQMRGLCRKGAWSND